MEHNEQIMEAIKDCLTVEVKFQFHGKMPWDEVTSKDTRDVYLVTLTNAQGKKYQTQYGQSISNSKIQIRDKRTGYLMWQKQVVPTIADVLYSIERNDPETFDDFCSNFGYDNDSIKAHKIYMEVQKQYQFMRSLPCVEKINEILQEY